MKKLLIASLLTVSTNALAQEATPTNETPKEKWKWSFGIDLGGVALDSETAEQERIEDTAFLIGASANYGSKNWIGSGGLDLIIYDDKAEFEVPVTSSIGGDSVEDSDADGILLSLAFGPRYFFKEDKIELRAQLGVSSMVSSERSISNCSNCPSQDIDIDGGAFLQSNAYYNFDGFSVGLGFQHFLSGDIDNTVRLSVSSNPF